MDASSMIDNHTLSLRCQVGESPAPIINKVVIYKFDQIYQTVISENEVIIPEETSSSFYYSPAQKQFLVRDDKLFIINLNSLDHSGTLQGVWKISDYIEATIGTGLCIETTKNCFLGTNSSTAITPLKKLIKIEPESNLRTTVSGQNLPFFISQAAVFTNRSLIFTSDSNGENFMMLDPSQINNPLISQLTDLSFTGIVNAVDISNLYFQALYTNQAQYIVKVDLSSMQKSNNLLLDGRLNTENGISFSIRVIQTTEFMIWSNDNSFVSLGNLDTMIILNNRLSPGSANHNPGIMFPGTIYYASPLFNSKSIDILKIGNLPCHQSCQTCQESQLFRDENSCKSCKTNYEKAANVPVGKCHCYQDQGKFVDTSTLTCDYCSDLCATCAGDSDTCASCKAGFFLLEGSCYADCPKSFFGELTSQTCKPCSFPCMNCEDNASKCNECFLGLSIINNKCIKYCGLNKFYKFDTDTCQSCDPNCSTCLINSGNCITCKVGFFLNGSNCISECPAGTLRNEVGECQKCWGRCKTCKYTPGNTGSDSYTCLSCKGDLVVDEELNKGIDNCSCPSDQILEGFDSNFPENVDSDASYGIQCRPKTKFELLKNSLKIDQIQFFAYSKSLSIKFKEEIVDSEFSNLKFKLKDSSKIPPKFRNLIPLKISLSSKKTLKIAFKMQKDIINEELIISSTKPNEIKSSKSSKIFLNYPINLVINYYENETVESVISLTTKTISLLSKILTLILAFFSLNTAIILIKIFQMIDFFTLINVNPPQNVKNFMSYFQSNVLDFVPNIFKIQEQESQCDMSIFLIQNGVSCNGLNNIGHLIVEIGFFFALILLIKIVDLLLKILIKKEKIIPSKLAETKNKKEETMSYPSWIQSLVEKLSNLLNQGVFWGLMSSMELDFFLGSCTSLKARGFKHAYFYLSNLILILLGLCFGSYIWNCIDVYLQISSIHNNQLEIQQSLKKYENLNKSFLTSLESFKKECRIAPLISAFQCLRDIILPFVIIFQVQNPNIQIGTISILSIIDLVLLTVYHPYADDIDHIAGIFNSILYILVTMLYLILSAFGDKLNHSIKYYLLGLNIVLLFTVLLLFNIFLGFVTAGKTIYGYISKRNKKTMPQKMNMYYKNLKKSRTGLNSGRGANNSNLRVPVHYKSNEPRKHRNRIRLKDKNRRPGIATPKLKMRKLNKLKNKTNLGIKILGRS